MKTFVLEVTPTVSADGSTLTFLFGTDAWATRPTDTPANTAVRPFLDNPGQMRTTLFSRDGFGGAIQPDYGVIRLADPAPSLTGSNELDDWAGYGIAGSRVVLRWGELGAAYPAAFTTVLIAYARKHEADIGGLTIWLRDGMQDLEQPIISDGFAGTGGLEGTGAVPKRKQFVNRDAGFITPILVDRVKQIYFLTSTGTGGLHDAYLTSGGTFAFYDVFDNAVKITRSANYTSEAELLSTAPSAGNVRYLFGTNSAYLAGWKNGPIYFRLGSPPAGDVRVFAYGSVTDADHARRGFGIPALVASHVAMRAGTSASRLGSTADSLSIGPQWADGEQSCADVLNDAAGAYHAWFGFDRLDRFVAGYLLDPEDDGYLYGTSFATSLVPSTSVRTFTEGDLGALKRIPVAGLEVPRWSVAVKAGRTAPSQIATGATSEMRDYLTREVFAAFSGISATTKLAEPGAEHLDVSFNGRYFETSGDQRIWLERFFVLFGGRHWFYTFTVPMTAELLALELHQVVTLQTRYFGLSAGRKHRIVGMVIDCDAKDGKGNRSPKITFTVWGGDKGSYTGTGGGGGGDPGGSGDPPADPAVRIAALGDFTGVIYGAIGSSGGSEAGTSAAELGDFTGTMQGTVLNDPYWSNVVLLMHCDQDSPWLDSSPLTATLTAAGTITASTSSPLTGTASMVPGALGKVDTPTSSATYNMGTGAVTFECTLYLTGTPSSERLFEIGGLGAQVWFNGSTRAPSVIVGGSVIFTGTAIPATTKGHLALVRTGASSPYTWTLYWQGTSIGSGTATTVDDGTTNRTITLGNFNSATQPAVTCKLDDIRVTKGVSRYTGSFTPPTVPYGP